MKKFSFVIIALLAFALPRTAKAESYNNESHVYLDVDGTTKYYKVSTQSWETGAVIPGTWGGKLWATDFGVVNSIIIKGGAVGGSTEYGQWLYGHLSYKVYPVGTAEPSDWQDFGDVANQGYATAYNGNNCFWYKNDGNAPINIAALAPGEYYLKINIRCGATDQYSAARFTVPAITFKDNNQHDWVLRFEKFSFGTNVKMLGIEPADNTTHSGCELTIPSSFTIKSTTYQITSSNSNIISNVAGLSKVVLPTSVRQMNSEEQEIDMENAQGYTHSLAEDKVVDAANGKIVSVNPSIPQ